MRKFTRVLLILLFPAACQTATYSEYVLKTALPVPTFEKNEFIIDHKYFTVSYDQNYRIANYVEYTLTKEHLKMNVAERPKGYTADPSLIANGIPYSTPNDIKYSRDGYVKGHLAPSTDFRYNQEARDLASVMTNIAPQNDKLNGKSWLHLEEDVRKWACGEGKVLVITGPVIDRKMKRLVSGVGVPKNYFKAIADLTPPIKTIAFLYSQEDENAEPEEQALSIEELQEKVGYELFPFITDSKILKSYDMNSWKSEKCYQ